MLQQVKNMKFGLWAFFVFFN